MESKEIITCSDIQNEQNKIILLKKDNYLVLLCTNFSGLYSFQKYVLGRHSECTFKMYF